ncbi:uncharacterized protein [Palaemon carinicauda]|uniref:uncharacterized protein n=1 Tax=Palaemon carinicauda TaxID=392227 RepID=UPI0035B60CA1
MATNYQDGCQDQLLCHIAKVQAHLKWQDVLLASKDHVGLIISHASKYGEVIDLAKAPDIRYMLQHTSNFSNTIHKTDLQWAVPVSLLQFVCMIEHSVDIKFQIHGKSKSDSSYSTTALRNTRKELMST